MHHREIGLRFGMPLLSRQPIPFERLVVVHIHAEAIRIKKAHAVLAIHLSSLSKRLPLGHGGLIVARKVGVLAFGEILTPAGCRQQHRGRDENYSLKYSHAFNPLNPAIRPPEVNHRYFATN